MKQNYKIKIGDTGLPDAQIDRHKNFESVLQRYNSVTQPIYRKPLYKNPKAFLGLVFIIVMAVLVFKAVEQEDIQEKEKIAVNAAEIPFQNPITPKLDIAPLIFDLSNDELGEIDSKETTLSLPEGIQLIIPAGAFGPGDAPVSMKVTLFGSIADRLAAGIPANDMTDNDIEFRQSLKLMKVEAFRGDAPVRLLPGKSLTMVLPAMDQVPGESLYRLDDVQRKWVKVENAISYENRTKTVAAEQEEILSDGFEVLELGDDSTYVDITSDENANRVENLRREATTEQMLIRKFTLDELGIWDFAIPYEFPQPQKAKVLFTDQSGKTLPLTNVYLIPEGMDKVFSFWSLNAAHTFTLTWDQSVRNQLVGINSEGRLVRVDSDAFATLEPLPDGVPATLRMETISQEIARVADLEEILRFGGE